MDLIELWNVVWRGKWLIILMCTLFGALGIAYALTAQKWYRAEVLLIPVKTSPADALASQFGGLASFVGLNVSGNDDTESLAVLRSREFARRFIEEHDLLPVLYADKWDQVNKAWVGDEDQWPDVRDAVTLFDRTVRRVTQDRNTGLVVLAIDWKDPELATFWVKQMASELNIRMSERAMAQAEANVAYLRAEMEATSLVQLQQPVARLLELELQKLMLARNSSEYAYRIVDDAEVPKGHIRPRRKLIVMVSVVLGGAVALSWLIVANAFASGRKRAMRIDI
ncbi:MAG TPA: Wzz/FepE/Etk N-terminal domain-containing protein [Gammaproteobacteria bacterium]|nr:Wzz/FepE/Etk N-terminal domain-containing protein [Gammaproteobacteria bacterium]